MKLLTINTHSIIEPDYENKLRIFVNSVYRIRPDIIAMQEVNQRKESDIIRLGGGFDVRRDNHAHRVCKLLADMGLYYNYIWRGIKEAYGKNEEGVAILTHLPIKDTDCILLSEKDDRKDWRTRYAVGVKIYDEWFYSAHMGRYDDRREPFTKQWERLRKSISHKGKVWIMGDFNCDFNSDGYKEVINSGWYDTYLNARERDGGITVKGQIDGWRDSDTRDMRIDYIFTNTDREILSSRVVFNGVNEPVISDHYGVEVRL